MDYADEEETIEKPAALTNATLAVTNVAPDAVEEQPDVSTPKGDAGSTNAEAPAQKMDTP